MRSSRTLSKFRGFTRSLRKLSKFPPRSETLRDPRQHWVSSEALWDPRQHWVSSEALWDPRQHWVSSEALWDPRQHWVSSEALLTLSKCLPRTETKWRWLRTLVSCSSLFEVTVESSSCVIVGLWTRCSREVCSTTATRWCAVYSPT